MKLSFGSSEYTKNVTATSLLRSKNAQLHLCYVQMALVYKAR